MPINIIEHEKNKQRVQMAQAAEKERIEKLIRKFLRDNKTKAYEVFEIVCGAEIDNIELTGIAYGDIEEVAQEILQTLIKEEKSNICCIFIEDVAHFYYRKGGDSKKLNQYN